MTHFISSTLCPLSHLSPGIPPNPSCERPAAVQTEKRAISLAALGNCGWKTLSSGSDEVLRTPGNASSTAVCPTCTR